MAKYLRPIGIFLLGMSAGMETCVILHVVMMGG